MTSGPSAAPLFGDARSFDVDAAERAAAAEAGSFSDARPPPVQPPTAEEAGPSCFESMQANVDELWQHFVVGPALITVEYIMYAILAIPMALATGIACSLLLYCLVGVTTFREGWCEQKGVKLSACENVVEAKRWMFYLLWLAGFLTSALYKYVGTTFRQDGSPVFTEGKKLSINTVFDVIEQQQLAFSKVDEAVHEERVRTASQAQSPVRQGGLGPPSLDAPGAGPSTWHGPDAGRQISRASAASGGARSFTGALAGSLRSETAAEDQRAISMAVHENIDYQKYVVDWRLTPLVFLGTVLTHATGGSAGREGTALQMSACLYSNFVYALERCLAPCHKLLAMGWQVHYNMVVGGISAGFAGIFGVPCAGAVFGIEVRVVGELPYSAVGVALSGAYVADWMCRTFSDSVLNFDPHVAYPCETCQNGAGTQGGESYPSALFQLSFPTLAATIAAGVCFGITAIAFHFMIDKFKAWFGKVFKCMFRCLGPNSWINTEGEELIKPMVGGVFIIILYLILCSAASTSSLNASSTYDGTDPASYTFPEPYLGLGVNTPGESISTCFVPGGVRPHSWFVKLLFTTITLGAGFKGGEVTPLFFIGAAFGNVLGTGMGQDPQLFAAMGFVAVFAGAAHTPLACTLMGIELFGGAKPFYFLVACIVSHLVAGPATIYAKQKGLRGHH